MRPIYAIDLWTFSAVYYAAEGYSWWWSAGCIAIVFLMLTLADSAQKRNRQ